MSRLFKIVALAMLVVAVTASGAMAAGALVTTSKAFDYKLAGNSAWAISGTTLGAAGVIVTYTPNVGMPANSTIQLTLTGATFTTGLPVYLAGSTTSNSASATAAGLSTITLTVNDALANGSSYTLTNQVGAGGASKFPSLTIDSGRTATVTIAVTSVLNPTGVAIDATAAAANILTTTATTTLTVAGTETQGVINVAGGKTSFTTAPIFVPTPSVTGDTNLVPLLTSPLFTYSLTITGDLTGISEVGFGTNASTSVSAAQISAGTKTITGTGDKLSTYRLGFTADGTTVLDSRSLAIVFTVTSTAEKSGATWTPSSTSMTNTWTSPEYQAIASNLLASTSMPTYCLISNNTPKEVSVRVNFINALHATTLPAVYTPSAIPAGGNIQLKFDTSVTPTYRSGAGSAVSLGLTEWDKYSVKFSAWPTSGVITKNVVTVVCNQLDGTMKRIVPVFTEGETITNAWKQ